MVTTFENDAYVYDALRAGASGFLLKRAGAEDLVQAVRLVARSDSLLFPAAVRQLAARHAGERAAADAARTLRARLTEREADGAAADDGRADQRRDRASGWGWARPRSRRMWRGCWPSSGCGTGPRR